MTEIVLWKLVDMALTAFQVGLERQAVVDKVKTMEAEGKTPEQMAEALKAMRDEALKKLD